MTYDIIVPELLVEPPEFDEPLLALEEAADVDGIINLNALVVFDLTGMTKMVAEGANCKSRSVFSMSSALNSFLGKTEWSVKLDDSFFCSTKARATSRLSVGSNRF